MAKIVSEFEDTSVFFDLDMVKLYCGFTKDLLSREQSEFKEQFDKKITELRAVAKDNYEEWYGENHLYLFDVFPSLQWLTLFNTAYSVFEKNINYICSLAETKLKSKVKLRDLKGTGIERAKSYLKKIANITEPFNSSQWHSIMNYSVLRNVLVHANKIDISIKDHKTALDFADNHQHIKVIRHSINAFDYPEITFEDSPEIILEPEIVFESIQEYRDFLSILSQCDLPTN